MRALVHLLRRPALLPATPPVPSPAPPAVRCDPRAWMQATYSRPSDRYAAGRWRR